MIDQTNRPAERRWRPTSSSLVLIGFTVVALYFLLTEHTQHFFAALPFLVFLLCPLMMLFMHGGHGGGHAGHGGTPDQNPGEPQ